MIFHPTRLAGSFLIEPERLEDFRGFFARTFCEKEFRDHGLNVHIAQCNVSRNLRRGTLRGMHYQAAPFEEAKLVRCTRGSIYDVIIDLRSSAATYRQHFAAVLSDENMAMLYIPEGFAHGFQTLTDNTEIFYQMSSVYSPEHARGVRWNDPAFGIPWPEADRIILDRDRSYPDFKD